MRFLLPLPPSTNTLFNNPNPAYGNRRTKTPRYKAWLAEAGQEVIRQRVGQKMPRPPYSISVWCYWGDKRIRDADNYNKAVQDLLASTLHFVDSDVADAHQYKRFDRDAPRCVVYFGHSDEDEEEA